MIYFPITFPDELYISILNRQDHLLGKLSITNKMQKSRPKITTWQSKEAKGMLRHSSNPLVIEKLIWNHTLEPAAHYVNDKNNSLHPSFRTSKYEAKMCADCILDDIKKYGVAYVHRTHNFPNVKFCHLHAIPLQEKCYGCNTDHIHHAISDYYLCQNTTPNDLNLSSAPTHIDLAYSRFVYDLLNSDKLCLSTGNVTKALLNRAIKIGLNRGLVTDLKSIKNYTEAQLDGSSLSIKNFPSTLGARRLSIDRYLLIFFAMFETAQNFFNALIDCRTGKLSNRTYSKLRVQRDKFLAILKLSNYENLAEVAAQHQELFDWLIANDRKWTITQLRNNQIFVERNIDEELAYSIMEQSKMLYAAEGIPVRVTKALIISKARPGFCVTRHSMKNKPCALRAFDATVESAHHYYIRLMLWNFASLPIHERSFRKVYMMTKSQKTALRPIAEHFGWITDGKFREDIVLPKHIQELKLPTNWRLPNVC